MASISFLRMSTCLLVNVLEVHLVVKRFPLQVTKDDVREVLTELVRIYLCQFGSASESAGVSLEGSMFRAGEFSTLSEDWSHYLGR